MKTQALHRVLSMLVTVAMVLNIGLTPVFAAEGVTPPGVSGVCTHHTEHKVNGGEADREDPMGGTADCGYRQGTPCGHTHTEDCSTKELTCVVPEAATDGEAHAHGENCYTQTDNCRHEHNEACGYTEGSPCTFDPANCEQCKPGNQEPEKVCTCEPALDAGNTVHGETCPLYEKPVCTCPPVDSGEPVHGKGCPLYTTPALSEAVKALIAMVDALPNADAITDENREAAATAFDAALTAYEALSGDDKAAFETTTQHEKLMALHTALYPTALMTNEATWNMKDGPLTLDNTCGADCAHTISGTSTGGTISVTGGTHNVTLNNVTIDRRGILNACAFEIKGGATVNLTLTGANTLKSGATKAGLQVPDGNKLTITGASTGSLTATGGGRGGGGGGAAGIGGGDLASGGTITISGGTVTGTGGTGGAGIGGGDQGSGGTININGGTITAIGDGSGIGGGSSGKGGSITIGGGKVTATGGTMGVGIGGSSDSDVAGVTITITGGTVTATGGTAGAGSDGANNDGAGIGGCALAKGVIITITGGTVTATGGGWGAGIGGSLRAESGTIAIDGNALVYAKGGVDAPHHIGAGAGGTGGTVTKTRGIVFEGEIGAVYGSVTLGQDLTIAPEKPLTINSDSALEVGSGVTFTNNGTINNLGTIISKGTLSGNGSLTGDGVVQTTLTESMISLDKDSYVYTGSAIQPTVLVSPVTYWGKAFNFAEGIDYTVAYADNTAASTTAKVTVIPKGSKLTGSAVDKTVTITTANSALGLITDKTDNTVTYGDTITFTATVSIPDTKARAVAANTVEFLCNGTSLGTVNLTESGGTGTATFTYNTAGKGIPIGTQTITARYSGSSNLNGTEQTIRVTLNPKPLTGGTITAGQSKPYDGNNSFSRIAATFVLANGVLGSDNVTATVGGTTSSSAVGTSLPLTVTSATLGAADAGFYLPPTNLTTITGNVEITAIAPVYNVADQKIKIDRTLTEIQAAKAATGVNNETVAGTLTWAESSGGNALPDYTFTGAADSTKTLYWTFAPTSDNYTVLSGSTVFTLTEKEVPVLTVSNIEKTYDGKAVTTVTGTAKVGEAPVAGTFAFDGTPPTMQDAKIYNATVKFTPTDSAIYDVATISITVTIRKATVEIAAALSEPQIVAGGTLPTPGIRYDGLVSGESLTPATTATFAGMPSSSTKGTYTITWSNKAAMQAEIEALAAYKNYTASYKDSVTLQISERSGGGSTGGSSGGSGGGGGGSSSGSNSSSGGSPSDSSILTPKDTTSKSNPSTTVESNVTGKTDGNGKATAAVEDRTITNAIDKAQKEAQKNGTDKNAIRIALNVKTDKNATSLEVTLSKTSIDALIKAGATELTVKNALTTLTFDLAALKALAGGNVILAISKVDVKTLSAEAQNVIGNRPVFRFGATVGGKAVTDFRGSRVGLQMSYTRSTTEQAGNLCAVYVDGNGKLTWLENSSYESITGMMLASTSHFSIYGVGYKQSTPKLTDVGTHWAKNDIDFVVARGLLNGTSNTTFAPDQAITRGALQSALEKLSGKELSAVIGGKSADTITRQDLAVLLVNYSKAIGYKLPSVHAVVTFTDASNIASWAKDAVGQMQMAGILMGKSGNRFDPTATATRAEVSAMIRRLVELMVNTETAEGWAMNDSGQWMYIENGKRTAGKKTVGGTQYTFDQYGVSTALPPERKYLTHIV